MSEGPKYSSNDLVRTANGDVGRIVYRDDGEDADAIWNPLVEEWEYLIRVKGSIESAFEHELSPVPAL